MLQMFTYENEAWTISIHQILLIRRMLQIPYIDRVKIKKFCEKCRQRSLMNDIRNRQLTFFRQVMRRKAMEHLATTTDRVEAY